MSRMPGVGQSFGSLGPGGALARPGRSDSRFSTSVGRREALSPVRVSVPEADQTGVATAAALQAVAGTTAEISEQLGKGLRRREERNLAMLRQTRLNQAESRAADEAFVNQRAVATVGRVMPALRENFANIEAEIRRGAIVPDEGQSDLELANSLLDRELAGVDEAAAQIIRDRVQPKLQEVITDTRLRFEAQERQAAVDLLAAGAVDSDPDAAFAAAQELDPSLDANDFFVRGASAALAAGDLMAFDGLANRINPNASPEDAIRLEALRAERDKIEAQQFNATMRQASDYIDRAVYDIGAGRYTGRVGDVLEDINSFVDGGVISADEGRVARSRIQSALQEQVTEQRRQEFASMATGFAMNAASLGQDVSGGVTIGDQQLSREDIYGIVDGEIMGTLAQRLAAGDTTALSDAWQSLNALSRSGFGMDKSETAQFLMQSNPSQINTEDGTVADRALFAFANYNGLMDVNAHVATKNVPSDMKSIFALARAGVAVGLDEQFALVQAAATIKAETQHGLSSNRITNDIAFDNAPEQYKFARRQGSVDPMLHLVANRARMIYAQGGVSDEQAVKAAWNELEGEIGMIGNQAVFMGGMTQQDLDAIEQGGLAPLWDVDNSVVPEGFINRDAVTITRQPWRGGLFVAAHEDGRTAFFTEAQMRIVADDNRRLAQQRDQAFRQQLRRDFVQPLEPYLPSDRQVTMATIQAATQAASIADRLRRLPRRIYDSNTGIGQLLRGEQNEFSMERQR